MSSYEVEKGKTDEKLNPKKKQETDWTQMLGLMALGQGASAKTMLGFALGKLLRELWDRHLWERRQKQMTPTKKQTGDALGTDGEDAGGTKAAANGYVPTRGLLGYKGAMERVSENRLRDAVAKSGNPAFQDFKQRGNGRLYPDRERGRRLGCSRGKTGAGRDCRYAAGEGTR